jgi:transposase
MRPYSQDLRQRALAAVDHKEGSLRQVARRFRIGLATLTRWLALRRATGSVAPKPHGGGRTPAVDATRADRLKDLVRRHPDATLDELNRRLGLGCSRMAIFRALRRLRISRKKKVLHASERDTPAVKRRRGAFRRRMARVDPRHLVFVDEAGADTAMTRTYGRAPVGERVGGAVPGHWESVTLAVGMRLAGVVGPLAFAGAMDTPAFESYVGQVLVPELRPGDVVIWDNLRPHQSAEARRLVAGAGARLLRLPPYSPDLTPIEKMFAKVKELLRAAGARTAAAVYAAMGRALKSVQGQDILGWFRSCGLSPTQT